MVQSINCRSRARDLMREYVGDIYSDIRAAKLAHEPIGYSTSNFAKELFEVMDLKIVYPENHAAGCSCKKRSDSILRKGRKYGVFGRSVLLCAH